MMSNHLIKKMILALVLAVSMWGLSTVPENHPDTPQLQIVTFDPIVGLFPEHAGASSYYGGPCGRTCQFGCCLHLVCSKCEEIPDQPPNITGIITCAQNGNIGWCIGNLTLNLSASDPQGTAIIISGNVNGIPFACPSGDTSCSIPLTEEGMGSAEYTVNSATGLSVTGGTNYQLDLAIPQLDGSISAVAGVNSWYRSNATLAITSNDLISGVASIETSIDGNSWTTYSTPLVFIDGVYTVNLKATDNAGNVTQDTQIIHVDSSTPSLSLLINGTSGKNGWYVSNVSVVPIATDPSSSSGQAGSGIAIIEASVDGGSWTIVNSPLTFTDGNHSYQFRVTDNAGNVTEIPIQTVSVDTIAPVIEMTEELDLGDTLFYELQDGGSELASYRVVIEDDAELYKKLVWLENIDGNKVRGQILWDGKFKDGAAAGVGDYYITLKISDAAGNESMKTTVVHVNLLSILQDLPTFMPPTALESASVAQSEIIPIASPTFGGETLTWADEDFVTAGFSKSGITNTATIPTSNILWGAAAVTALGTFFANVERKRREQREKNARQKALINTFQMAMQVQLEKEKQRLKDVDTARWSGNAVIAQAKEQQLLNDVNAARWAGNAAIAQAKLEEEKIEASKVIIAPVRDDSPAWWEKAIDWIDGHQTELSIITGLVVAVTTVALVVTAPVSFPILGAMAIAALVAGGTIAAGTLALNTYYDRDLTTNLVSNLTTATVTAAVATGIGIFLFGGGVYMVGSTVTAACANNPIICTKVEPVLSGIDTAEQTYLQAKLAYQIWAGNAIGALETKTELDLEYMDGGMPGNVIAHQLGELGESALELVATHGDDVIPLLLQYGSDAVDIIGVYGDDAVDIIGAYGDEGITLLLKFGKNADEAIGLVNEFGTPAVTLLNMVDPSSADKLLRTLDDDVLDYAIKQGPDAVSALSRWSNNELTEFGPELALRAEKDAKVIESISMLISLEPIDPKHLTTEQQDLINIIAENSMQYTDGGQIVLGKWVDYGHGFTSYARETGSVHYNPHPDMWDLFGEFGKLREDTAWLVNKEVIQIGIDKGLPFEYTLEGVPVDTVLKEQVAIQLLFSGATELEVKQTLKMNFLPIRMKELQELRKAGYNFTFDEISNSFIFSLP